MDNNRFSSIVDFTKVGISIVGKFYAITLPISLEDLKKIEKYRPEALQIRDENDAIRFKVAAGVTGSISDHGVTFNDVTRDDRRLAIMTGEMKDDVKDAKMYFAAEYGKAFLNLKNVIANLGRAVDSIENEMNEVIGYIQYADAHVGGGENSNEITEEEDKIND